MTAKILIPLLTLLTVAGMTGSARAAAQEPLEPPDAAAIFEQANITEHRILFAEDFEGPEEVTMTRAYAGTSPNKVTFSGLTEEEAFSGKRSYKISVTFQPAKNGAAYFLLPHVMPAWHDLKLKMYVKAKVSPAAKAHYYHGFNGADAEAGHAGYVANFKGVQTGQDKGWEIWEATARRTGNVAAYVMGPSLYMQIGEIKVPTTVTFYLDNVTVEGRLPHDWEEQWPAVYRYFTEYADKDKRATAARRLAAVKAWQAELDKRFQTLAAPEGAPPLLMEQYESVTQKVKASLDKIAPLVTAVEKGLADQSTRFAADINAPERLLIEARNYLDIAEAYPAYAKHHREADYVTFALDVTQSYPLLPTGSMAHNEELSYFSWSGASSFENPQILPDTKPIPAMPSRRLGNFGCRGTYVPYSFAIHAGRELPDVTFTIGDMKSASGTIPAADMDLRVVAPVYLPWGGDQPRLVNCMLLHDPEFVVALPDGKNAFKDPKYGSDAETLLPLTIPAGATRQFYLLVHVPENAPPGTYEGDLEAATGNGTVIAWDTELEVLPFDLEPAPYAFGAFCRSWIMDDESRKKEGIHGWRKTFDQFERELVNMGEHGFNTLNLYSSGVSKTESGWDFTELGRVLDAAVRAGLSRSPFVWYGHGLYMEPYTRGDRPTAPKTMEEVIANINALVPAVNAFCRDREYPRPAFFGHDEASGEALARLKPAYSAITNAGGIMTQACYAGYFAQIGTALGLPIVFGGAQTSPGRRDIKASQDAGDECWIYNCPATNMQASPSAFRRRYGLALYKNGEQGVGTWAYGDMGTYNFEERKGRPVFVFAFPTWTGKPIDTIIYEAYREGITDTRYMATLEKYLAEAKAKKAAPGLVVEVEKWLETFSVNDDLNAVRRQMADFIVSLRKATR